MFTNIDDYGYGDYGSKFSSWRRRHGVRSPSSAIAKVTKEVFVRPVQQVSRLTQKIGEKTGIKPLTKLAKGVERIVLLPANVLLAQTAKREERAGYRKEAKKGLRNVAITAAVVGGAVYGPGLWAAHPGVASVATGVSKTVAIGAGTTAVTGAIARRQMQEEGPVQEEGPMQEEAVQEGDEEAIQETGVQETGVQEGGIPIAGKRNLPVAKPMSMLGGGQIPIWMIGAIGIAFIYMIWEGRSRIQK